MHAPWPVLVVHPQSSRSHVLWQRHPAVRAADQLTARGRRTPERDGSWTFVAGALILLGGWMLANGIRDVDPYPFILGRSGHQIQIAPPRPSDTGRCRSTAAARAGSSPVVGSG